MRHRAVGPAQGETGGAIELHLGGGLDVGKVDLHDIIKVRLPGKALPPELASQGSDDGDARVSLVETTAGRVLFNESFPDRFEYVITLCDRGETFNASWSRSSAVRRSPALKATMPSSHGPSMVSG